MRKRGRVDETQTEVVAALRQVGATVQRLADVGAGVPDLLVGFRNTTLLVEVKGLASVRKHPPTGLTEDQKEWHQGWNGAPVHIVRTAHEALEIIRRV